MTDIDASRVLDIVEGRDEESANELRKTLPELQRANIDAVSIGMWAPNINATQNQAPNADIVHDKFHIAKHLNEAVDQVRRAENQTLSKDGKDTLKGTKQLWLFRESNLPEKHTERFNFLKQLNLKTARAWAIKESFQGSMTYAYAKASQRYFNDRYG